MSETVNGWPSTWNYRQSTLQEIPGHGIGYVYPSLEKEMKKLLCEMGANNERGIEVMKQIIGELEERGQDDV